MGPRSESRRSPATSPPRAAMANVDGPAVGSLTVARNTGPLAGVSTARAHDCSAVSSSAGSVTSGSGPVAAWPPPHPAAISPTTAMRAAGFTRRPAVIRSESEEAMAGRIRRPRAPRRTGFWLTGNAPRLLLARCTRVPARRFAPWRQPVVRSARRPVGRPGRLALDGPRAGQGLRGSRDTGAVGWPGPCPGCGLFRCGGFSGAPGGCAGGALSARGPLRFTGKSRTGLLRGGDLYQRLAHMTPPGLSGHQAAVAVAQPSGMRNTGR